MHEYQKQFIGFLLENQALQFGKFSLKSGRSSPYFFNTGKFQSGLSLERLGVFYAAEIARSKLKCHVLYGPAYKGIPLVSASAIALRQNYDQNVSYCFGRKELKCYGDKGKFVGAPLQGHIVMLDDVMTAGKTTRRIVDDIISDPSLTLTGIVTAFDRQEYFTERQGVGSVSQEISQDYNLPVISIVSLDILVTYLKQEKKYFSAIESICEYREKYGIKEIKK